MRIQADLRPLTTLQPTTSLTDKVFSGSPTVPVINTSDFSVNDYIILGILGLETTEMRQITGISSGNFTLSSTTTYDHPQDTLITKIPYNQITFYYSTALGSALIPLGNNVAITPDNFYTYYDDLNHSTGFGWFQFYNSTTTLFSSLSNAAPYADFDANSVKKMLDRFFTQLGNRERKLIHEEDAIEWLNEGYAKARNRLNIVNRAYNVPTPYAINIVAGTQEYALPEQFAKVRTINHMHGHQIHFITLDDMPQYQSDYWYSFGTDNRNYKQTKYYLRNNMVGFTPLPGENTTYFMYYQTSSPVLKSYLDYIDLPNNNFYFLLDWMLYRACPLTGGNAANYLQSWNNNLNEMIITSHKQDNDPERWDIPWSQVV